MQYGKILLITASAAMLAACATTSPSNDKIASETQPPRLSKEVTTTSIKPVNVPKDLSSSNIQSNYQVPDQATSQNTDNQTATLAPPGSNLSQTNAAQTGLSNPATTTTTTTTVAPGLKSAPAPAPVAPKPAGFTGNSLTLNVGFEQAWPKVGRSLSAAGYPVMEQDNASGAYYVVDKVSSGGVIKRDTPIYQVHLEKQGPKTTVTVINPQNQQSAPASVTSRILTAVKNSQ